MPAAPDVADGRGSLFAPGGFLGVRHSGAEQIALNLYGFYYRRITSTRRTSGRPDSDDQVSDDYSQLYVLLGSGQAGSMKLRRGREASRDNYEEHQFRVDGTVEFAVRKFEISARNMYVRRFRPTPADDTNRYRGRIAIAHPLAVQWPHLETFCDL